MFLEVGSMGYGGENRRKGRGRRGRVLTTNGEKRRKRKRVSHKGTKEHKGGKKRGFLTTNIIYGTNGGRKRKSFNHEWAGMGKREEFLTEALRARMGRRGRRVFSRRHGGEREKRGILSHE
jgi:hypothetical protein